MPAVIFGMFLLLVILMVALVISANKALPEPKIYATGTNGSITELFTLPAPPDGPIALTNFAARVATECLDLKPSNYEYRFERCEKEYFTPKGFQAYKGALNRNGVLGALNNGEIITDATLAAPVNISSPGSYNNLQTYTLEVPIQYSEERVGQRFEGGLPKAVTLRIIKDPRKTTKNQFRVVQFYLEARI